MESEVDDLDLPEPSLWNNQAFNVMKFTDYFFSFSENLHGDYQLLFNMSPAQLSAMLKTQLLR